MNANVIKFKKVTLNSIRHNAKIVEKQTRFPKELVEIADLYKPVLVKIMTTYK